MDTVIKHFIEKIDDVLLLNPGGPIASKLTDPIVMLMRIKDGEVDVEIKKMKKQFTLH